MATIEQLEKELARSQQRVEDLRNVGKAIRGNPDARAAAEALEARIASLAVEVETAEKKIVELEAQVRSKEVERIHAEVTTETSAAQNVQEVLNTFEALRAKALATTAATSSGKRSLLDIEIRTWAHPFVGRAFDDLKKKIEEALGET